MELIAEKNILNALVVHHEEMLADMIHRQLEMHHMYEFDARIFTDYEAASKSLDLVDFMVVGVNYHNPEEAYALLKASRQGRPFRRHLAVSGIDGDHIRECQNIGIDGTYTEVCSCDKFDATVEAVMQKPKELVAFNRQTGEITKLRDVEGRVYTVPYDKNAHNPGVAIRN